MDPHPSLDALRAAACDLDDAALAQLIADLQAELEARQALALPAAGREVIETQRVGAITYRQELVRCGKPCCRCTQGQLHGPYWYRYERVNGKLKRKYLGKTRG